jgi:hypothetical protein
VTKYCRCEDFESKGEKIYKIDIITEIIQCPGLKINQSAVQMNCWGANNLVPPNGYYDQEEWQTTQNGRPTTGQKICLERNPPYTITISPSLWSPSQQEKDCFRLLERLPIAEEDRYLTTFITPWGRYKSSLNTLIQKTTYQKASLKPQNG